MSRTDKTKPWMVRVAEHHPWAEHDHRNGECNLPDTPLPKDQVDRITRAAYDCYWSDWNICTVGRCCSGCGCRTCSGYHWRRADRRRSRHQARTRSRAYVTGIEPRAERKSRGW